MNKRVLYVGTGNSEVGIDIQKLQSNDYIIESFVEGEKNVAQVLNEKFYYFVLSFGFENEIYKICAETATKYVVCIGNDQRTLYETFAKNGLANCYFILQSADMMKVIEDSIFSKKELAIYQTINQLCVLHENNAEPIVGLKHLRMYDEEEVIRLTDRFFDKMESEKGLSFLLKEQLLEYVDICLKNKTKDAWKEILLWNRRHECRDLVNCFWQFFLLQKAGAIYAEEMIQYYNYGEEPSVIQIGSFEELFETYFQLLLLLRRLSYDVASDEQDAVIEYIVEKNLSGIFIRHVIENNKVGDKEKVYRRLEELLAKYEQ